MTEIGGGWYMGKSAKWLPPLKRPTLSKKAQDKEDKIKKNYMKLMSGGMIGNFNYIGTTLNGWIQEAEKRNKPFSVSSMVFTWIKMIELLIGLVIQN